MRVGRCIRIGIVACGVLLASLTVISSAKAAVTCGGKKVTIKGTTGDDPFLLGTKKDDVIAGLGGDDIINAGGGEDIICGGAGDDELYGGGGSDRIFGEDGDDILSNGPESGVLNGGPNSPAPIGGDTVTYAKAPTSETVKVNLKKNTGHSAWGFDSLIGIENVFGSKGADILTGDANANGLYGGEGNDGLTGSGGDDYLDGGANIPVDPAFAFETGDIVNYQQSPASVGVYLNDFPSLGTASDGLGGTDTIVNTESAVSSPSGDILYGDNLKNFLFGGGGNDTISGSGGDDSLFGDNGDDTLWGGFGSDKVDAGGGSDTCNEIKIDIFSSCETVNTPDP